jgi:hypothetical protein
MYRGGRIARGGPLWAPTGAGAGGPSRRVDRGDPEGVLGVADAFPRLVSRLARACNDHDSDATRFVLTEAPPGPPTHGFHHWSSVRAWWNATVVETRQPAPADLTDKGLVRASA